MTVAANPPPMAWYGGSFAYFEDDEPAAPDAGALDAAAERARQERRAGFSPEQFGPRPGPQERTGVVLGRFLPVHDGHRYLIELAQRYADRVHVFVRVAADDPIPWAVRRDWLAELFPGVAVTGVEDAQVHWPARILAEIRPDYLFGGEGWGPPLAARVIAGLLCTPGAETEAFLARARALERADADARNPQARRAGLTAMAEATEALRNASPDAPVPAALHATWGDDDLVGAHSLMLLFAGVETTQNLIVNTVHALLSAPDRWPALNPGLIPGAVEEGARFAPPVLGVLRRATRDTVLAGHPIPAGTELVAMTASANRDPARFPDPDRFDPARTPNPHLSFGLGRHYCPGAELTRLTTRAALTALRESFPALTLTGPDLAWRNHDPIVHAPTRLPVTSARVTSAR